MLNFNISKLVYSKTTHNILPYCFRPNSLKGTTKTSRVNLSRLNTQRGNKGTTSFPSFFYGNPLGGTGEQEPWRIGGRRDRRGAMGRVRMGSWGFRRAGHGKKMLNANFCHLSVCYNTLNEWMNEWMNECVFIYRTYHIVSQGGLQFYFSEIRRQLENQELEMLSHLHLMSSVTSEKTS